MAIGTGDAVEKFGTRVVLESNGGQITTSAFVQASVLALTATDDVVYGSLVLEGAGTAWGAAPDAGGTIDVYLQALDIDGGTGDANAPSANFPHIFVGSFPVDAGDAVNLLASIDIGLENVQSGQTYTAWLRNNGGQNFLAGWTLDWIPKAIGPKA